MKYLAMILIFCFGFTILKADTNFDDYSLGLKGQHDLFNNEDGYLNPFPVECTEILNAFAQYASNFTMCSIMNARPIRLCTNCVDQYTKFYNKYQELINKVVNDTSCKSIYVSHDRLDAILEYYNNMLSIWDKGNCNNCFNWTGGTAQLSNSTKHFNQMYNETMECIIKNLIPATNNSEEVCEKCMQSYLHLDDYYKSLSKDTVGVEVCMDIVDAMNATRSIWSKSLNCCKLRKSPEIVFLCCTAIISLLPLLFYLSVRFCGPIRDLPNVLKQSRFKQAILRSVDRQSSSIN